MMMIDLRPTQERDLAFVLAAEQDPENRQFILPWTRDRHQSALTAEDIAHRIVEQDTRAVGFLILAGLSNGHQSLELQRIVITKKNQGYGRLALRRVKQLAFETWKAHRLWLDVKAQNVRAKHLYQTEGFIVEGTLRECLKAGSHWESLIVMSMLRHEYDRYRSNISSRSIPD